MEIELKYYQDFINTEFNKLLKLRLEDKVYNVVIRKDHIPQIKNIEHNSDTMIISFTHEPTSNLHFENNIASSEDKSIRAVLIDNLSNLHESGYRADVNALLLNHLASMPTEKREQVLLKHSQTRVVHALIEIIKNMPNKT